MYYFNFQKFYINLILIEKNLIKSSQFLNYRFYLKLFLYFLYKNNLKDKNIKIDLLHNIFIYLRLIEQLTTQRCLFKIVNYRWSFKIKELTLDNVDLKKEIVYCLFSHLLNNELINFVNFKRYFLSKEIKQLKLKTKFFFYKKTFGFVNFILLDKLFKTNNLFLKKLYKHRLYFHYHFFYSAYYNKMIINLFGCI